MQQKIILKVNQIHTLEVENLGGAGYSWVVEENNEKITSVKIESGVSAERVKKMPVGSSIKMKVIIKALAVGNSFIKLSQKRLWEKNVPPVKKFDLTIVVEK